MEKMMSNTLYDKIDSNDLDSNKEYSRFYQPNFTRSRQYYRSPRESGKVNLEINQLLYDLTRLKKITDDYIDSQKEIMESFTDGFEAGDDKWPNLASDTKAKCKTYQDAGVSDVFSFYGLQEIQTLLVGFLLKLDNYTVELTNG